MDLNALSRQTNREHDSCGIFSRVEKSGVASRKTVLSGVAALKALRHRAGYVQNEGDGCGLLLDIPKLLWQSWIADAGLPAQLAHHPLFAVMHLFLSRESSDTALVSIEDTLVSFGYKVLVKRVDVGNSEVLGPSATKENPVFVQLGILREEKSEGETAGLYTLTATLDNMPGVHVASLSRDTVVYKVVGDGDTLWQYYSDLQSPFCTSTFSLAHTRYSTNTATAFKRVQPFALLGHNGEINTIARFYTEARMVDIPVLPDFSDSQMVDAVLHCFVEERGFSLFEAAELIFPPIVNEIKQMPSDLSDLYMFYRALWGPFAQGPAAVMMRFGREAVFTVDALGLRPMWLVETEDAYCFSSEQGIVPMDEWTADPKPLAPGEKVGLLLDATGTKLFTYPEMQREVLLRSEQQFQFRGEGKNVHFTGPFPNRDRQTVSTHASHKPLAIRAAAFGWREDDVKLLEFSSQTSGEAIRSLGYDGPLPVLDDNARTLSDFLHETVAVVTNPAIDREREMEHFSTRTVLGKRPSFAHLYDTPQHVELQSPLLLQELPQDSEITLEELQMIAHRHGTLCYEDVLAELHTHVHGTVEILIHRDSDESLEHALERFRRQAVEAVQAGANAIVLDDRLMFARGKYVDPFLAAATVDNALQRPASSHGGEHLRRRTSVILKSGGLRNLHDLACALGLGVDAVVPYMMWEQAAATGSLQSVENLYVGLCKGIEKVLSTLGIHELRGYQRLFSAIGLSEPVAALLSIPNFCGNDIVGYSFADMEREADLRQAVYDVTEGKKLPRMRTFQLYPRIWKSAGSVALGEVDYESYYDRLSGFERENPISLRHLLGFQTSSDADVDVPFDEKVDTSVDIHSYPFLISSMSFGSQNETAYRAYAEAAQRLNIVGLNGEGGEIKDLLAKYPKNRGRQVASGRFGVNAELCNDVYVLEIKIGQGAKPGEGGHLPGSKVTVQVANARNAAPGVDLISPSNNHDIYSIEDLAQVIFELKTINPFARVAVKVPVVPNIGTIAVGIVKAGADVVELSGFDGGTGAARAHALRHVGLPVEVGIKLAHQALCESGLRDKAEIWADGGMKSGADAMKAILLGANRVGFGTMAMVAIGCTSCRACHKDTCHVGIATQMTDLAEAVEKGLKEFMPRDFESSVERLVSLFGAFGRHLAQLTRQLGASRTQDLVGRSDLLEQVALIERVDLSWLTSVDERYLGLGTSIERVESAQGESHVSISEKVAVGMETAATQVATSSRETSLGHSLEELIRAVPRVLGTYESGDLVRSKSSRSNVVLSYPHVAGNGFAAYHAVGMHSIAHGGAQDGVGKASFGGRIVVLKQRGKDGVWRGGSVGKGLAYGAQHGVFVIQGNADARAGIRLSGADVIIGGEVESPLQDELAWIGARSNIKGFAFEYMTAGRALVLGDPGPWICAGMTGGSVYVRLDPAMGLTEKALRRRIAKGAKVSLRYLDAVGENDVAELIAAYVKELKRSGQNELAARIALLGQNPADHFMVIRPGEDITDQSIATE